MSEYNSVHFKNAQRFRNFYKYLQTEEKYNKSEHLLEI